METRKRKQPENKALIPNNKKFQPAQTANSTKDNEGLNNEKDYLHNELKNQAALALEDREKAEIEAIQNKLWKAYIQLNNQFKELQKRMSEQEIQKNKEIECMQTKWNLILEHWSKERDLLLSGLIDGTTNLREKLVQQNDVIEENEKKINTLQGEIETSQNTIFSYEQAIINLKEEKIQLSQNNDNLKNRLKTYQNSFRDLETESKNKDEIITNNDETIKLLKKRIAELENVNQLKDKNFFELQGSFIKLQENINNGQLPIHTSFSLKSKNMFFQNTVKAASPDGKPSLTFTSYTPILK